MSASQTAQSCGNETISGKDDKPSIAITFVQRDGTERTVRGRIGTSLMEAAVMNDIRGIDANCGGACACATCHVYLPDAWRTALGVRTELEVAMLDLAEGVQENSRLSCQIDLTPELEGLTVLVADTHE